LLRLGSYSAFIGSRTDSNSSSLNELADNNGNNSYNSTNGILAKNSFVVEKTEEAERRPGLKRETLTRKFAHGNVLIRVITVLIT
jgi:hypothetical protein